MLYGWTELMVHEARRADLLREAAHERMVRQALAGRKKRDRLTDRALAWLGERMLAWGGRLQARYGVATTAAGCGACRPVVANR
jgi:hypothetical protein